jgi:hypothetical protein
LRKGVAVNPAKRMTYVDLRAVPLDLDLGGRERPRGSGIYLVSPTRCQWRHRAGRAGPPVDHDRRSPWEEDRGVDRRRGAGGRRGRIPARLPLHGAQPRFHWYVANVFGHLAREIAIGVVVGRAVGVSITPVAEERELADAAAVRAGPHAEEPSQ